MGHWAVAGLSKTHSMFRVSCTVRHSEGQIWGPDTLTSFGDLGCHSQGQGLWDKGLHLKPSRLPLSVLVFL